MMYIEEIEKLVPNYTKLLTANYYALNGNVQSPIYFLKTNPSHRNISEHISKKYYYKDKRRSTHQKHCPQMQLTRLHPPFFSTGL